MKSKVTDLTVEELKDIIKEVVREEIAKSRVGDFPTFVPYYIPCYKGFDYENYKITYTDHTEELK